MSETEPIDPDPQPGILARLAAWDDPAQLLVDAAQAIQWRNGIIRDLRLVIADDPSNSAILARRIARLEALLTTYDKNWRTRL
jgi:hypothetical protein